MATATATYSHGAAKEVNSLVVRSVCHVDVGCRFFVFGWGVWGEVGGGKREKQVLKEFLWSWSLVRSVWFLV